MFFLQHEAAFNRGERIAGNILEYVHVSLENYVDAVRFTILSLGSKRTTVTRLELESLCLQSKRASAVMGYRESCLQDMMPRNYFHSNR